MSTSTKLVTLFSIIGILALGPLIWFIATIAAPALLPEPDSGPLRLIPVSPHRPTEPATFAPDPTVIANMPQRRPLEPIADRWRFRADGSLELTMDAGTRPFPLNPLNRSQP